VELTVYPAPAGAGSTTKSSAKGGAAGLILAHGAGAGQASPFMTKFAKGMAERGIATATFDFPYMRAGRKLPDPPHVLENAWREALEAAPSRLQTSIVVIGGKSMGGRIASQVAAQGAPGLSGLVFFGYPLHPPGKPQQRRDAHLPRIAEPQLFVQGTRDAFGTAVEIRELLKSLQRATLHEVEGGDHSFKVSGRGVKPDEIIGGIMDVVAAWILRR
jgi:predicted alpha/beta-hydrolase family hydrolase